MTNHVIHSKDYLTTSEAAEKWRSTRDEVAEWCRNGYVEGAKKVGRGWRIPRSAQRPVDLKLVRELLWAILKKKNKDSCEIDLSSWGLSLQQIEVCYELLLDELYLGFVGNSERTQIDFADIFVTERGIALLRNGNRYSQTNGEPILRAVSTASGVFAASFVKTLIGV